MNSRETLSLKYPRGRGPSSLTFQVRAAVIRVFRMYFRTDCTLGEPLPPRAGAKQG